MDSDSLNSKPLPHTHTHDMVIMVMNRTDVLHTRTERFINTHHHPTDSDTARDMHPIHRAAYDGDVAAIDRLVAEDFRRVNAQIQGNGNWVDGWSVNGCSPLMLAALKGHDAAVARLLALGADVGLEDRVRLCAVHWVCVGGDHSSVLALLLDAGASLDARSTSGTTP